MGVRGAAGRACGTKVSLDFDSEVASTEAGAYVWNALLPECSNALGCGSIGANAGASCAVKGGDADTSLDPATCSLSIFLKE